MPGLKRIQKMCSALKNNTRGDVMGLSRHDKYIILVRLTR
jgi:hypothetical protein